MDNIKTLWLCDERQCERCGSISKDCKHTSNPKHSITLQNEDYINGIQTYFRLENGYAVEETEEEYKARRKSRN